MFEHGLKVHNWVKKVPISLAEWQEAYGSLQGAIEFPEMPTNEEITEEIFLVRSIEYNSGRLCALQRRNQSYLEIWPTGGVWKTQGQPDHPEEFRDSDLGIIAR
jgi:hypothetical protein